MSNRQNSLNTWPMTNLTILIWQWNYHRNQQAPVTKSLPEEDFLTIIIIITIIMMMPLLPGGQCACDGEGGCERQQGSWHQCLVHRSGCYFLFNWSGCHFYLTDQVIIAVIAITITTRCWLEVMRTASPAWGTLICTRAGWELHWDWHRVSCLN